MSDEVGKAWREYMAVPHERFASERLEGFLAGWHARDAEVAELREQLAERDAVIERVREWNADARIGPRDGLDDILDSSPSAALIDVQADAWDEGWMASENYDGHYSVPTNPYRKVASE